MHVCHRFCWCLVTCPMAVCLTCIFSIVLSSGRNVLIKEGYSLKVSLASGADTRAVFTMNSPLLSKPALRFLVEGQSRKRKKIPWGRIQYSSHMDHFPQYINTMAFFLLLMNLCGWDGKSGTDSILWCPLAPTLRLLLWYNQFNLLQDRTRSSSLLGKGYARLANQLYK